MNPARLCLVLGTLLALGWVLCAQEVVVDFCHPEECRDFDPDCCAEDSLEIVFPDGENIDNSVFEYDEFEPGTRIEVTVVTEVVSDGLHGFSFGVKHDEKFLDLIEDTVTTGARTTRRSSG